MASGHMPHTSMRGLWLATYALGLILVQLLLGLALRSVGPRTAQALRRIHFVLMIAIAALVLTRLWSNGPFF
jgi:cytochrome c biogenesis protein CcdA